MKASPNDSTSTTSKMGLGADLRTWGCYRAHIQCGASLYPSSFKFKSDLKKSDFLWFIELDFVTRIDILARKSLRNLQKSPNPQPLIVRDSTVLAWSQPFP